MSASPPMATRGRRVAITGYGVVAPCGLGKQAFWNGLNGPSLTGGRTVEIADWDPLPYFANPKEARRADRFEQFALAAADECFIQSGRPTAEPGRFGVILGTGVGGLRSTQEQIEVLLEKGERRVSPFLVPMMMANAAGAAISMRYGLQGPNETVVTACAAATHAIGYAARLVAWGMIDACVTGGSESAGCSIGESAFGNMTALSTVGHTRPFSPERDGFVLGEGAGVLMLEEWQSAVDRGATILGEVLGAASNADAHHITAPAPGGTGAIVCMNSALSDAGLSPGDIKQLNAHGTSTPLNDKTDTTAIKRLFGEHAYQMAINSTKSMLGHSFGGAGAIEALATIMAVFTDRIHPTINYQTPDPDCDLDYVPNVSRAHRVDAGMCNGFGLGGQNASLVLKRFIE